MFNKIPHSGFAVSCFYNAIRFKSGLIYTEEQNIVLYLITTINLPITAIINIHVKKQLSVVYSLLVVSWVKIKFEIRKLIT